MSDSGSDDTESLLITTGLILGLGGLFLIARSYSIVLKAVERTYGEVAQVPLLLTAALFLLVISHTLFEEAGDE